MSNRAILPQRRNNETSVIWFNNTRYTVTVGYYSDFATPGEVFINGAKTGTDMDFITRDGSIVLSLALQHGVPVETLRHAIARNSDGTPASIIGEVVDRMELICRS